MGTKRVITEREKQREICVCSQEEIAGCLYSAKRMKKEK